tara:strand:- start:18036 stop:19151 length:1116 start_codon:yes stop_codon:yes gene_type:complete
MERVQHRSLGVFTSEENIKVGGSASLSFCISSSQGTSLRPLVSYSAKSHESIWVIRACDKASRVPVVKFIEQAETSIDLWVYKLNDPNILAALKGRVQCGVQLRIITCDNHYKHCLDGATDESVLMNPFVYFKDLEGVEVKKLTHPELEKFQQHGKAMVVDAKKAIVTTGNWDRLGGNPARDFVVFIDASEIPTAFKELQKLFEADWSGQKFIPTSPKLLIGPFGQRARLSAFVQGAQKSLWMYQQSFNDPELSKLCIEAIRRGVEFRLLMMEFPFGPKNDNEFFQQQIVDAGGELVFDRTNYVHGKLFIRDGEMAYLGSCNFYPGSVGAEEGGNREIGYIVGRPEAIADLEKTFTEDWMQAVSMKFADSA